MAAGNWEAGTQVEGLGQRIRRRKKELKDTLCLMRMPFPWSIITHSTVPDVTGIEGIYEVQSENQPVSDGPRLWGVSPTREHRLGGIHRHQKESVSKYSCCNDLLIFSFYLDFPTSNDSGVQRTNLCPRITNQLKWKRRVSAGRLYPTSMFLASQGGRWAGYSSRHWWTL